MQGEELIGLGIGAAILGSAIRGMEGKRKPKKKSKQKNPIFEGDY